MFIAKKDKQKSMIISGSIFRAIVHTNEVESPNILMVTNFSKNAEFFLIFRFLFLSEFDHQKWCSLPWQT